MTAYFPTVPHKQSSLSPTQCIIQGLDFLSAWHRPSRKQVLLYIPLQMCCRSVVLSVGSTNAFHCNISLLLMEMKTKYLHIYSVLFLSVIFSVVQAVLSLNSRSLPSTFCPKLLRHSYGNRPNKLATCTFSFYNGPEHKIEVLPINPLVYDRCQGNNIMLQQSFQCEHTITRPFVRAQTDPPIEASILWRPCLKMVMFYGGLNMNITCGLFRVYRCLLMGNTGWIGFTYHTTQRCFEANKLSYYYYSVL